MPDEKLELKVTPMGTQQLKAISARDIALWGEDAVAVRAVCQALDGHHPERGGIEREQAAFAVVQALKQIK